MHTQGAAATAGSAAASGGAAGLSGAREQRHAAAAEHGNKYTSYHTICHTATGNTYVCVGVSEYRPKRERRVSTAAGV